MGGDAQSTRPPFLKVENDDEKIFHIVYSVGCAAQP